jgi:SAM-dependent methyltransferase
MVDIQKEIRYSGQIKAFQTILETFDKLGDVHRILVLGCGNGLEAGYMHHMFDAEVHGVDIGKEFDPWGVKYAHLQNYDGEHLPYADGYFDAIYSYHVLEHVENVPTMLAEIRRVIRPEGFVYVGVPNKSRLLGYIGMNDKSLYRKVRQNVIDIIKRLKGEWDNSLGAHAGFKESELSHMLGMHFRNAVPVTRYYYSAKWKKYDRLLRFMQTLWIDKVLMPSVYVLASD